MSDPGIQDTPMHSRRTPSATQLCSSQNESPHWDTDGLAKESNPSRWGSMPDGPSHLPPDRSQQACSASSATSKRETIVVGQNTNEGALNAEGDETVQTEQHDEKPRLQMPHQHGLRPLKSMRAMVVECLSTQTLYDADYEKNKVTLIQSVFLMGHFYADAEDRVGLCGVVSGGVSTTVRSGCQWAKVDQCGYLWIIAQLRCRDYTIRAQTVRQSTNTSYQTRLTRSLEYGSRARPSRATIEGDENEIRANWIHDGNHEQSPVLASHVYQYRLHTQATIIALYRPFLHETPDGVPDDEQDPWKALVKSKLRAAAAHATHAINCMMAEDLIKFAQTITVLTISPPIQIHLLEMASSKSSSGKIAKHNLALCLLALDEMRKYYVSADAAYKLFDRARIMVEKSLRNDEIVSQGSSPVADCPQEHQVVETSEWLDDSAPMGYEVPSVGLFSALWMPFANLIPDESLDNSF
ncbi:cutinase transcription factor 1 beta [Fusarium sp. NRRL 52700]|nr:cutinase transcription factor 1 beta [Fusarium sp. NRRL 52700]